MKNADYVTITILADNTATPPYRAEHGFSALVRRTGAGGAAVLFDTGRGALFDNASAAGVDLSGVTDAVLSHGHYDHTDALSPLLRKFSSIRIHAAETVLRDHFSLSTGTCRNIAVSGENRAVLAALPEGQFRTFGKGTTIADGRLHLAGNIARLHPLETPSPLLFADAACTVPDMVPDESVLWFGTPSGLVILTGCCHAGFINTCEHVRAVSGINSVNAVIGGFHLAHVPEERLRATADYIERIGIRHVVPCHCTGDAETGWLRERLGAAAAPGECGMTLVF